MTRKESINEQFSRPTSAAVAILLAISGSAFAAPWSGGKLTAVEPLVEPASYSTCKTLCIADKAACLYSGKSKFACLGKLHYCLDQCRVSQPNRDALIDRPRAK